LKPAQLLTHKYAGHPEYETPAHVVYAYYLVRADQTPWLTWSGLTRLFGRAGGTAAHLYGPAIGEVHVVRSARITLEHAAPRERIGVVGYLTVEAEGDASAPGNVRCGIPGFDHPGTELHGDALQSTDPALHWEVRGRRHAAFATDFDYRSGP
jgi:hypothetical protein